MQELQKHIEQIKQLCDANNVKSLFAFGSVVSDKFTNNSDIDLIVDIDNKDPFEYADNYFDLKFQLADLLNRKIDLLEDKAISNPFLKKQIEETKVLIYAK
jgi:predicted nucleotidyltransferase